MPLTRPARESARRVLAAARAHWLLTALLAAGLALRAAAQAAYRPALIYIDSYKYLHDSGGADPVGYSVLLKPLLAAGNLDLAAALQHLAGLAMAVALYALLRRRGAARWLSALAVAPVLLDAYQVQIEQTIMPDTAFEAAIVAGLGALLWRPRPGNREVIAAGLALGASATVRQVGEIFILPALVYLAAAAGRWRAAAARSGVFAAAFAAPILAYCAVAAALTGHFRLSYTGVDELYGRVAAAADCAAVTLPAYERPLCPSPSAAARLGPDGLEHSPFSPMREYQPPANRTLSRVVSDFNGRVLAQQPWRVAAAAGADAVRLFSLTRTSAPGAPIRRWQFQRAYPLYVTPLYSSSVTEQVVAADGRAFGGGPPAASRPLAAFLRAYQLGGGYTPGPFFLAAVVAGLAGTGTLLRRRLGAARREAALASLLVLTAGAAVLGVSDLFQFSWRYQLPALVTLPPAAAFGIAALLPRPRGAARTQAGQGAARTQPGAPTLGLPASSPPGAP